MSVRETERVAALLNLIPPSGEKALDVGTRDGHMAKLLASRYAHVVALDIVPPRITLPRIENVQGDVAALPFEDDTFDAVLCSVVLEHIPPVSLVPACAELVRVTKGSLIIGVPYRQDLRCGRTTCGTCGSVNPPWGHINSFDESSLNSLFPSLTAATVSHVGSSRERTNALSATLMNFAGNPFGTYDQDEACVHCRTGLIPPATRTLPQRLATRLAFIINHVQRRVMSPRANWIHIRFDKAPRTTPSASRT
jgi:SAM-dependent methyltransferase